jgi:hypothetical protein
VNYYFNQSSENETEPLPFRKRAMFKTVRDYENQPELDG